MKILFIAHEMELGGATLALLELIDGLQKKDVDICVLLPNNKGILLEELKKKNIQILICKSRRLLKDKFTISNCINIIISIIYNYIVSLLLSFKLKKMNISFIHTNSSVTCFGAFLSYVTGIPHIQHIREFTENDNRKYVYMKSWILNFIKNNTLRVITVSDTLKDTYKDLYKEKILTIYDGIKMHERRNLKTYDEKKVFNICVIGAVCELKGQIDAIESIGILIDRGITNIKLTIVGKKEEVYYKKLIKIIQEKKISRYIEFIDFNKDINNIRRIMNLELNCSRSEGFGRTTVEAMMNGIPIVGADNTATLELIGDDESYGMIYKTGNAYDLAKKIQYVMNNQKNIKVIRDNAYKFVKANLTDYINLQNIYMLYSNTL